ncbi:hypothetical protein F5879DRAFT_994311 [Lentinula edodes]|nr:hypothetical protein F5879DRAFT_994311 [Lentinula edodes]
MNWPENVRVAPDDDLFEDTGHIASYGSMFDPSTNSLAAATMQEKAGPQRAGLFGNGDGPPSGLAVEVIRPPMLPSTGNLSIAELLELANFLPQNKNVGWAAYIPLPPASIVGNVSSSAFWELAWSRKSFAALTRLETKLQNSGRSDDSQSTFISLALVKRNDVGLTNIIPDPFIWSDDGYDSADDDDNIQNSIPRERKKATAASKSKRDYAHASTNEIANQRQRAESAAVGSGYRKAWGR